MYIISGTNHAGSSPLARGLQMRRNNLALEVGIIPARAGFTLTEFNNSKSIGDHPRSRGVYNDFKSKVITAHGSSPLARGLQAQMAAQTAYNSSRGVYAALGDALRVGVGSSPLARGLLFVADVGGDVCGIIPARAGFTAVTQGVSGYVKDHPRSRGVYHTHYC